MIPSHWSWPQLVLLGMVVFEIGYAAAKHRVPRTGEHDVILTAIAWAIILFIVFSGGFFR